MFEQGSNIWPSGGANSPPSVQFPQEVQDFAIRQAAARGADPAELTKNPGAVAQNFITQTVMKDVPKGGRLGGDEEQGKDSANKKADLSKKQMDSKMKQALQAQAAEAEDSAKDMVKGVEDKLKSALVREPESEPEKKPDQCSSLHKRAEDIVSMIKGDQQKTKVVCPLPSYPTWSQSGTACPDHNRKKCLNGNTPYNEFKEAWDRCSLDSACEKIMYYKEQYYLRRADDPAADNGGNTVKYECPEGNDKNKIQ